MKKKYNLVQLALSKLNKTNKNTKIIDLIKKQTCNFNKHSMRITYSRIVNMKITT